MLMPTSTPRHIASARQSLSITGLGTETFRKVISTIHVLDHLMCQTLSPNSAHPWVPSQFDEFPSIEISNRYFTRRSEILADDIASFSCDIDPTGILARRAGDTFTHAVDNVVVYYDRVGEGYGMQ